MSRRRSGAPPRRDEARVAAGSGEAANLNYGTAKHSAFRSWSEVIGHYAPILRDLAPGSPADTERVVAELVEIAAALGMTDALDREQRVRELLAIAVLSRNPGGLAVLHMVTRERGAGKGPLQ